MVFVLWSTTDISMDIKVIGDGPTIMKQLP